jgi:hypothetical protein
MGFSRDDHRGCKALYHYHYCRLHLVILVHRSLISTFTLICRRHGVSAFGNVSTRSKMNSQELCDVVLQEVKEIARAMTEKVELKER